MPSRKLYSAAFTLIELIVVIAIVALMTAIAVPTMSRMGMLGRDPIQSAARQSVLWLKGARLYAGSHRIDAAVVYMRENVADSRGGGSPDIPVVKMGAIVQRLNRDDLAAFRVKLADLGGAPAQLADSEEIFAAIRDNSDTLFTELAETSAILLTRRDGVPFTSVAPTYADAEVEMRKAFGFSPVWVLKTNWKTMSATGIADLLIRPTNRFGAFLPADDPTTVTDDATFWGNVLNYRFPAHIFRTTGVVQDNGEKERYVLRVGPSPDAPKNARYYDNGGTLTPVNNIEIALYSSTGRVETENVEFGPET